MKPAQSDQERTQAPRPSRLRDTLRRLLGGSVPMLRAIPAQAIDAASPPVGVSGLYCTSGRFAGKFFPLCGGKLMIGRNPEHCNLVFPVGERGVSAVHCELILDESSRTLVFRDLGSSYGTRLFDGTHLKAHEMAVLRHGQSFLLGENNRFTVYLSERG